MNIALMIAVYLALWPVPIDAVRWDAPPAPGLSGPFVVNAALAAAHRIDLHGERGPEHVLAGPDGRVYVGVASGRILRLSTDGGEQEVFATIGGRPLGMAFDAAGRLVVADAVKGLVSIAPDRTQTVLVKAGPGAPLSFPNAVVVADNGRIYLTDSSQRFTAARWGSTQEAAMLDIMEQSATGRVLEVDPGTLAVRVVAKGLSLANGIALSADQRSLFVSESGRYRVWNIGVDADALDLARHPAGARIVLDNLPGFPDNLVRGRDGRIWLGLAGPRNELDALAGYPFLRELTLRIPCALWPAPRRHGHVLAFTEDGTVVEDLQDPSGRLGATTGLTEAGERRYIHDVDSGVLAWLARPGATIQ